MGAINSGITHSQSFGEIEACVAARLDPYLWMETDFYNRSLKATIMAWHKFHNLILAHIEDARYVASKRKTK